MVPLAADVTVASARSVWSWETNRTPISLAFVFQSEITCQAWSRGNSASCSPGDTSRHSFQSSMRIRIHLPAARQDGSWASELCETFHPFVRTRLTRPPYRSERLPSAFRGPAIGVVGYPKRRSAGDSALAKAHIFLMGIGQPSCCSVQSVWAAIALGGSAYGPRDFAANFWACSRQIGLCPRPRLQSPCRLSHS
jgi:hypothetical protein